jgi:hypothetical protein
LTSGSLLFTRRVRSPPIRGHRRRLAPGSGLATGWAIAGVWPCVRFSTETDGQSTFHQDGLVSRRNHSPALVIACVFRERSDRCDAHEVRCNLRHDAATRNLERTRRQARRPGWPPHDVARWHDAARRNATRSGEAAVKVAMVQRPESPRHVANG